MALQPEGSRGWVLQQALAAGADQEDERHRRMLEALADVAAGRVIDHRSIPAWEGSLTTCRLLPPPAT
jgi:predicted transcriptional regulator